MEKEQRRRKIISRGNDRLALITGRIQTLEDDALPKSSSFNVQPSPSDQVGAQHVRSASESATTDEKSFLAEDHHRRGEDDAPETIATHDSRDEVFKENVAPQMQKREKKAAPPLISDNANISGKFLGVYLGSLTLKEINFSIITSEDMRVMCSIVLAVIVVLYHAILPHDAASPKSLIAYRPMYVLLLTDVFIVGTKLAPYAQNRKEERKLPNVQESGEVQDWGGAIKLLELGLVLHQTIRALFIDLSFYAAIVICGLHLM